MSTSVYRELHWAAEEAADAYQKMTLAESELEKAKDKADQRAADYDTAREKLRGACYSVDKFEQSQR